MDQTIFFNRIYIIQWLRNGDIKTGEELARQLGYLIRKEDIPMVQFCDVRSKNDLIKLLADIKKDTQTQSVIPYLHFETHGNKDGLGLELANIITWEDFRPLLADINHSVKNNLFVSVAACFGGFIFRAISMFERLPFCAFVGPPEYTYSDEVQIDWQAYFQTLLKFRSFGQAVDALNENNPRFTYFYYSSDRMVARFYSSVMENYHDEGFINQRIDYVVSLAKQDPQLAKSMNEEQMRNLAKREYPKYTKAMAGWENYITMKTDVMPELLRDAQLYFQGRQMS